MIRTTARNNKELAHLWANGSLENCKANNFFFEGELLYSYGHHFVVGRRITPGVCVITKERYGQATSKHIAYARAATTKMVFANDPSGTAEDNKKSVLEEIDEILNDRMLAPRIRETTKVKLRAQALELADSFNAYLAVLPSHERTCEPINTESLESARQELIHIENVERAKANLRLQAREEELKARLEIWRQGGWSGHNFHDLPVALRLAESKGTHHTGGLLPDRDSVGRKVIQTSHGAEIPADLAPNLWRLVTRCRETNSMWFPHGEHKVGYYRLTRVEPNGDLVVGCHHIPYEELHRMAITLGLEK